MEFGSVVGMSRTVDCYYSGRMDPGSVRVRRSSDVDEHEGERVAKWVGAYPALWLIGFAPLFWVFLGVFALRHVLTGKFSRSGTVYLAISATLFLSSVVGVAHFGFSASRMIGLLANICVWISLAWLCSISVSRAAAVSLSRSIVVVGGVQGLATAVAVAIYPAQLPVPLLSGVSGNFPQSVHAFMRNNLAVEGWLGETTLRSAGLSGNPTWAGGFAAIAFLVSLWLFYNSSLRWRLVASVSAVFSLYSVELSLSRMASMLLVAAIVVVALTFCYRHLRSVFPLIIGGFFLAAAALTTLFRDRLYSAVLDLDAQRAGSSQSRGSIYRATFEYVTDLGAPIVGYGIKPQEDALVASIASHSTYLGILFRGGAISLLLYAIAMILLLRFGLLAKSNVTVGVAFFVATWTALQDLDTGHLVPFGVIWVVWIYRVATKEVACDLSVLRR